MEWIAQNWEVFSAALIAVLDVVFASIDNSKVKYKGIILRLISLLGDASKAAVDHDNGKNKGQSGSASLSFVFSLLLACMLFFGLIGCAGQIPFPDCNDHYNPSKLKEIAARHKVCLQDVGNGLIVANGIAIGIKAYTAQDAISVVDDAIELLNKSVSEIAFASFVGDYLTKFPGLIEVSSIYLDGFDSDKYLDKESKVIIQTYLRERVKPILERYARQ